MTTIEPSEPLLFVDPLSLQNLPVRIWSKTSLHVVLGWFAWRCNTMKKNASFKTCYTIDLQTLSVMTDPSGETYSFMHPWKRLTLLTVVQRKVGSTTHRIVLDKFADVKSSLWVNFPGLVLQDLDHSRRLFNYRMWSNDGWHFDEIRHCKLNNSYGSAPDLNSFET